MYTKIPLTSITKISIVQTSCKKTLSQVKSSTGAQYVFNGGLYNFSTCKPLCKLRADGVTYVDDKYSYFMYCWNTNDPVLVNSKSMASYKNGIACVCLLKDGKKTKLSYNSDVGGTRGRTAMGLDAKGNLLLFCSKDGTSDAMSPEKLQQYMLNAGAVSALMLDGGGSSQCDFNGARITSSRKVANWICVYTKTAKTTCPYKAPVVNLKFGSRGEGVKWLQWHLNQHGYPCGTVDGIFGTNTKKQVIAFQTKNGLTADGIVGPATRKALSKI